VKHRSEGAMARNDTIGRAPVRPGKERSPMQPSEPVFTGVGAALITLFDETGEIDYDATAAHATRLVDLGLRAIIVAGTAGEVDALADDERLKLFEAVRARVPASSGAAVIAGTGAPSTRQAKSLTAASAQSGVDALLARSPRGVTDPRGYYHAVVEAARKLPVLAYHFPAAAPPGIPLEMLGELPVSGCKDSSGDPERLLATLDAWQGRLYVGSSALLLQAGLLGASGAILALANAEPELCAAAFAGDPDAQLKLTSAHLAAGADFPRGIKHLTAARFDTPEHTRIG
jgi:dihydrodipicolinate synthase/N-acetylneuraminate lyase